MNAQSLFKRNILLAAGILFAALSAAGCGDKVLATYAGGEIKESKLTEIIDIMGAGDRELQPEVKKQVVKQIVLIETLSEKALEEGIDKESELQRHLDIIRPKITRDILMKKNKSDLDESEEKVYRARHILFKVNPVRSVTGKDGKIQQVQLTEAELNGMEKTLYARMAALQQDIVSGKITFEEAAKQNSQDPGSATKGGDLGYFTKGIMVGEFQHMVEYQADEISGMPARVLTEQANIYAQPDAQSKVVSTSIINQSLVVDTSFSNDKWKKVILTSGEGYIPSTMVEMSDKKEKVSKPFRAHHGWHIVEVLDTDMVDKDGFTKMMAKTEFKDEEKPEEAAKMKAEHYWNRVKEQEQMRRQKELMSKYGFSNNVPELPANWQKMDVLIDTGSIKVTKSDLMAQVNFMANDDEKNVQLILADPNTVKQIYREFLMDRVYDIVGRDENVYESSEFKLLWDYVRKSKLAELYIRKHWQGEITVIEEELKLEYENYKNAMEQRKAQAKGQPGADVKIESYAKMKERLEFQIKSKKMRQNMESKQAQYLASIQFNLNEDSFVK